MTWTPPWSALSSIRDGGLSDAHMAVGKGGAEEKGREKSVTEEN